MLRAAMRAAALMLGLVLAQPLPAHADYPERPVTIIVSLAAGSGMDVLVRLYADKLAQSLGKPVIVENRPGASLMLAANAVAVGYWTAQVWVLTPPWFAFAGQLELMRASAFGALAVGDHVVRRRDERGERACDRLVVAERREGPDRRHGSDGTSP